MNDPEAFLRRARLAQPSQSHDRRMLEIFSEAGNEQPSKRSRLIFWPGVAFLSAAGIAAVLALVIAHRPKDKIISSAGLVYSVESRGEARQILLEPLKDAQPQTQFEVSVRIE